MLTWKVFSGSLGPVREVLMGTCAARDSPGPMNAESAKVVVAVNSQQRESHVGATLSTERRAAGAP
jgi:hypothetical protein